MVRFLPPSKRLSISAMPCVHAEHLVVVGQPAERVQLPGKRPGGVFLGSLAQPNCTSWSGSAGVTGSLAVSLNVYRNSTSPVPIDAGHRIASGITETNYTDCGNVNNGTSPLANCLAVWPRQTAV